MLKIAARATKQTIKLSANDRNRVASIRFGKPSAENPRCPALDDFTSGSETFELREIEIDDTNGIRFTSRNNKLNPRMKNVANHGPINGDTVPTRASDSPSNDIR